MKRALRLIAAILALVMCRTAYADISTDDKVRLFRDGVERFQAHKADFSSKPTEISYDVKKTDSLLQPIIGVLKVMQHFGIINVVYEAEFVFRNGRWTINNFTAKHVYDDGRVSVMLADEVEGTKLTIDKYFVSP